MVLHLVVIIKRITVCRGRIAIILHRLVLMLMMRNLDAGYVEEVMVVISLGHVLMVRYGMTILLGILFLMQITL